MATSLPADLIFKASSRPVERLKVLSSVFNYSCSFDANMGQIHASEAKIIWQSGLPETGVLNMKKDSLSTIKDVMALKLKLEELQKKLENKFTEIELVDTENFTVERSEQVVVVRHKQHILPTIEVVSHFVYVADIILALDYLLELMVEGKLRRI